MIRRLSTALLLCTAALAAGCVFDSTGLSGVSCTTEGAEDDGRICQDGFWVDTADMNAITGDMDPGDMGREDMPAEEMCVPETPAELCMARGVECGTLMVLEDNCGMMRNLDCTNALEGCPAATPICNASGECVCEPEPDDAFCMRTGAQCGVVETADNCGDARQVDCTMILGGCMGTGEDCVANSCSCDAESDLIFCGRNGAQCGDLTAEDNCGMMRTAPCGMCEGNEMCQMDNTCPSCKPETDEAFCARNGGECGSLTASDNCGTQRTVNCSGVTGGGCSMDRVCGSGNDANTCVCPDPTCRRNQVCGLVTNACGGVTDCAQVNGGCGADESCMANACVCDMPACPAGSNCGETSNACGRTTSCGSMCASDEICAQPQLQCQCVPEGDRDFCSRNGATCGELTAPDNCGTMRTVNTCGTCSGTGEMCMNNTCSCMPESDATFCSRASAVCGEVTANDNCGTMRTVNSCGTCTGTGEMCMNNACSCAPEDDPTFCSRNSAECGELTASDNCGTMRTVTSCGTCTGTGEMCTSNTCSCTAEDNAAFCSRNSAVCGELTANDNCGVMRTVMDCGTCSMGQSCQMDNTCGCAAEDDAAFCARAGAVCGEVTANDNCGVMRTVTSCGMCPTNLFCDTSACAPIKISAPRNTADDQFGFAVALGTLTSTSRELLVVGAPNDDTGGGSNRGAVYVFERNATTDAWTQLQVLTAGNRSNNDNFGAAVDFDGERIIVGAPDRDSGGNDRGEAYIYTWNSGMNELDDEQNIDASNKGNNDRFGTSVAIDGDYAVVGAPFEDGPGNDAKSNGGAVYVFERDTMNGNWSEDALTRHGNRDVDHNFGSSVDIEGTRFAGGAPGLDEGAAYIFERISGMWSQEEELKGDNNGDLAGSSVSLSNDRLISGAPESDPDGSSSESGEVFTYVTPGSWTRSSRTAASTPDNELFGSAVCIAPANDILAITALRTGGSRNDPGAVTIYDLVGGTDATYTGTSANQDFGASVAASSTVVVVGAPGDNSDRGAVFIYLAK